MKKLIQQTFSGSGTSSNPKEKSPSYVRLLGAPALDDALKWRRGRGMYSGKPLGPGKCKPGCCAGEDKEPE